MQSRPPSIAGSRSQCVPCSETPLTAWGLLKDTVSILYKSFWPLILIFAATDITMYTMHRVSHRITNQGDRVRSTCHTLVLIATAGLTQMTVMR